MHRSGYDGRAPVGRTRLNLGAGVNKNSIGRSIAAHSYVGRDVLCLVPRSAKASCSMPAATLHQMQLGCRLKREPVLRSGDY